MIGLLQRVTDASVSVSGKKIAHIKQGLLVLIGVEKNDTTVQADRLLTKLLGYRMFSDNEDKMNLSVQDINGGLLLVPQFTLPANTQKGMRPSFTPAADPATGKELFTYLSNRAQTLHEDVATGLFGADMQVSLTNDGPVTFWLQIAPNTL